jgi:(p)ppGpp synthase/HD superfamily hydrolase
LHDTVEDTDLVTFERIENEFGPTVRRIVEGETKVHHHIDTHLSIYYGCKLCYIFLDYVVN